MTVDQIIEVLSHRVTFIREQRLGAVQRGDIAALIAADAEITETEATLTALRTLSAQQARGS